MKKKLVITSEETRLAIRNYGETYYLTWLYKRMKDGGVPVGLKETAQRKYTRPLEKGDIVVLKNFHLYIDGLGTEKVFEWEE